MKFEADAFSLFIDNWAILTAGDKDSYNGMTVSWGGIGTIWKTDGCTVYVRKSRYTHEFMDKSDYYTLSFFPEQYKPALDFYGKNSGRNVDKAKEAGLTPVVLENGCITYAEASMTLVIKKLFSQDMDTKCMKPEIAEGFYSNHDDHTIYIGEIVDVIKK